MRQLPYRAFLWVFSFSNAIVWFFILYALSVFVHHHLGEQDRMSRTTAVRFFASVLLLPVVLALQGAIVNLREQFLIGRFTPPADGAAAGGELRNVWRVALWAGGCLAAAAVPIILIVAPAVLPAQLSAQQLARRFAATGALVIFGAVLWVSDREFRRYLQRIDEKPAIQLTLVKYVWRHIALPWGLINLLINAVLAWITYGEGAQHLSGSVAVVDLRLDLSVMAVLLSIFMALSALPEAETDFRRNLVRLPQAVPAMPRLWTRYLYAAAAGVSVYVIASGLIGAAGVNAIPLWAAVCIKAAAAGCIAAVAAGICAVWALARCAARHAAATAVGMVDSASLQPT